MSEEAAQSVPIASVVPPESGVVYRTVTRHWPKIAAGLVFLAGVSEWVIGGLTADSGVEFYFMTWAATTGGLWFLFEKAETALAEEGRTRAVGWLNEADFSRSVESLPDQFALLFDRVFGERHLSRFCFNRSCWASLVSFTGVFALILLSGPRPSAADASQWYSVSTIAVLPVFAAALFNFVPDYLSLLETRWIIGRLGRGSWLRALALLGVDLLATASIALTAVVLADWVFDFGLVEDVHPDPNFPRVVLHYQVRGIGAIPEILMKLRDPGSEFVWSMAQASVVSAFFTSVWLWIYAASVLVSRFLVKVGGGVGFLLKVTDVEHQPFRSMGFTAVVLTSLLFLAGLPLVLLG